MAHCQTLAPTAGAARRNQSMFRALRQRCPKKAAQAISGAKV
jgi:hypothetical protein